jgi:hypothetical protein
VGRKAMVSKEREKKKKKKKKHGRGIMRREEGFG